MLHVSQTGNFDMKVARIGTLLVRFRCVPARVIQRLTTYGLSVAMLSCFVVAGCGGEDEGTVITKAKSLEGIGKEVASSGSAVVTAGDLADMDLPAVTDSDPAIEVEEKSWDDILAMAKGAGKPVVLDIWSLNCEPCMREFPGLVRLHEEYGDDLVCISANIEFDGRLTHPAGSYYSEVMRFLRAQNAKTKNFLCTTPNEDVYSAVEIDSIPAVLIFDAQGNEVRRFVDAGETLGFTYDENVIPAVREIMGASQVGSSVDSNGENSADSAGQNGADQNGAADDKGDEKSDSESEKNVEDSSAESSSTIGDSVDESGDF